jgi:serine/threonine protein kinase
MEVTTDQGLVPDSLADQYVVMEELGSGCITSVHRAIHVPTSKSVALKRARTKDEGEVHATKSEYELLKRLSPHPHIIKVIDFHILQGHATLVLEFFDGMTLHDACSHEALPEPTATFLMGALFQAVGHVHGQGLLHRDVKPHNVLVSRCLRDLRLIDFNVAGDLDGGLTPTGTILYKAPELLLGQSHSTHSDVWASALCFFFGFTGTLPQGRCKFRGPYAHLQMEAALKPISFDEDCWQNVSDPCKALLKRCLAMNPEDRPEAAEVALDIYWMRSFPAREVCGDDFDLSVSCNKATFTSEASTQCLTYDSEGQASAFTQCLAYDSDSEGHVSTSTKSTDSPGSPGRTKRQVWSWSGSEPAQANDAGILEQHSSP